MKLFKNIKNVIKKGIESVKQALFSAQYALVNCKGEGFVESGVKILIAVVIGALSLGGLYLLFNSTILPTLTTKIQALFNYTGK